MFLVQPAFLKLATARLPQRRSMVGQNLPSEKVRTTSNRLRKELVSFLDTWLLKKDTESTLKYFADSAFSNQAMLSEPCAGYLKEDDTLSGKELKAVVERFLVDFEKGIAGKSLEEILNPKRLTDGQTQGDDDILNDPMHDGFILLHIGPSHTDRLLGSERSETFLKNKMPTTGYYASIVPIHDGAVYFLWIEDKGNWRIYHADLVCQ